MLQTVKQFIQICKDEDYTNYFQDYVFSLSNQSVEEKTKSIHNIAWCIHDTVTIDKAITQLQQELKEMI